LIGLTQFMVLSTVAAVLLYKLWTSHKEKASFLRWLYVGVLCGIASVPALVLAWLHRVYTSPIEVSIYQYLYVLYGFTTGFSFGPPTYDLHLITSLAGLREHLGAVFSVGVVGGIIVISGLTEAIRKRKFFLIVVPVLTLIPVFIFIFAVGMRFPIKNPRQFISLFPFFVLFIALGISSIKPNIMRWAVTTAFFILVLISSYNYYLAPQYHKEGNREAAGYVQTEASENDTVFVAVQPPFLAYYHGKAKILSLTRGDAEFFRAMDRLDPRRGWVVLSRPWEFDQRGEKERFLRARATLHEFQHVQVFHIRSSNN